MDAEPAAPTPPAETPAKPEAKEPTSVAWVETLSQMVQVVSVVVGVIMSVLSFNSAREAEFLARTMEAETKKLELEKYAEQRKDELERRQAEAAKPFLELRQKMYLEAVQAAGVLANASDHPPEEVQKARVRFRQLYVTELSLVEGWGVEIGMVELAKAVDPQLRTFTKEQEAAYFLAHALRDSLVKSWKLTDELVDNPGE